MKQKTENPAQDYVIRLATPADALEISLLYHKVYQGKYSDPLMREVNLLTGFLMSAHSLWVIALHRSEIIGSVVYEVDIENRLAKTFGGVVHPDHRGAGILERSLKFGQAELTRTEEKAVEVVYATTRTATRAPQIVTHNLGYRKLGIFPNVHRTDTYETHCLVALFLGRALKKRFTGFQMHPDVDQLFQIVRTECELPELEIASREDIVAAMPSSSRLNFAFEILDAPNYTLHRFRQLRDSGQLGFHFYPFHEPNVVVCSPGEEIQIFLYLAPVDKYCTIVGMRHPASVNTEKLLTVISKMLREKGVRYIETLVRADKLATVEHILNAGFIPSAYFPAFQVQQDKRYDYIVMSKTFEILDFSGIELAGVNKKYLLHYFDKWKVGVLGTIDSDEETE